MIEKELWGIVRDKHYLALQMIESVMESHDCPHPDAIHHIKATEGTIKFAIIIANDLAVNLFHHDKNKSAVGES